MIQPSPPSQQFSTLPQESLNLPPHLNSSPPYPKSLSTFLPISTALLPYPKSLSTFIPISTAFNLTPRVSQPHLNISQPNPSTSQTPHEQLSLNPTSVSLNPPQHLSTTPRHLDTPPQHLSTLHWLSIAQPERYRFSVASRPQRP